MTPKCAALALAALAAAPGPCPAQDHFGAYAVLVCGEWVQSNERLSVEKSRFYVESFRSVDFDARAWARLARAAGMKYAVMTAKNGNLLLNVGPDARGRIPEPSVRILEEVGRWMGRNGESILGAGAAELPKPEWGRFTRRGRTLYAHWMYPRVGHIDLGDVGDRVKSARLLHDGSEAKTARTWWGDEGKGHFFVNVAESTYQTFRLPDPTDTVFAVELE